MKDIEQNTALPHFESNIYKGNIPEDSKDYNYSESTSTKVEEKIAYARGNCTESQN